jgi:hypothetical protein
MLRFQSHPDKVFTAILKDGIGLMMDEIHDAVSFANSKEEVSENLKPLLPNAGKVFNPETAFNTLREMLVCLQRPELYYLNDYHYLLIYDMLSNVCDLHNAAVRDTETQEDRIEISQIGDYYIEELLFDEMIDLFFYDTDFLFDSEDMLKLGLEGRNEIAVNKETFAITQGLAPHPEELKIKVHKGEKAIVLDSSPYFGSKSKVYPDFNYKKGSE